MGLRLRLFLFVILPITVVVGAYGVMRARQEARDVVDAETRSSAATARAVQIAVEHALRDQQIADIQRLVERLVTEHPQIERIAVVDTALAPLAAMPPERESGPALEHLRAVLATGEARREVDAAGVARYSMPLGGRSGVLFGAVDMVFSVTRGQDLAGSAARGVALRVGVLAAILTALTTLAMRRQVLRPLSRLVESMRALGEGRTAAPLPVAGRDELAQLAQAWNQMVTQLEEARARAAEESEHALDLEKQLRRAQLLTVAGKLTSSLAHEVGTPLNVIAGRAEMALRALPKDHPAHGDVATIAAQAERIAGIIRTLLDSMRGQKPDVQPVALEALLPELAVLLGHDARRRRVALEVAVPRNLPQVPADPGQIQQVILNLLVNALDATPAGGRVRLAARAATRDGRPGVTVTVADTGPGIAPDVRDRIFEPFFTTKPPGEGTGLGLSISRDIVREHGGRLRLESGEGEGATFAVWLPEAERT